MDRCRFVCIYCTQHTTFFMSPPVQTVTAIATIDCKVEEVGLVSQLWTGQLTRFHLNQMSPLGFRFHIWWLMCNHLLENRNWAALITFCIHPNVVKCTLPLPFKPSTCLCSLFHTELEVLTSIYYVCFKLEISEPSFPLFITTTPTEMHLYTMMCEQEFPGCGP